MLYNKTDLRNINMGISCYNVITYNNETVAAIFQIKDSEGKFKTLGIKTEKISKKINIPSCQGRKHFKVMAIVTEP